jgi:hypothetical protein
LGQDRAKRNAEIAALRLGDLGMTLIDTAEMYNQLHREKVARYGRADLQSNRPLRHCRMPCRLRLYRLYAHTTRLRDAIEVDGNGFVKTGLQIAESWPLCRQPFLLETSLPGIFAAGDVRCGSTKRVASPQQAKRRWQCNSCTNTSLPVDA